jgi:hypothetical protein
MTASFRRIVDDANQTSDDHGLSRLAHTVRGRLTLAVAMTVNGIVRERLLKRVLSAQVADAVSAAAGILLITIVAAVGFRPLVGSPVSQRQRVALSAALVLITVVFETALGRFVDHKSWAALLGHYSLRHGHLWPLVLGWLASMPFVVSAER